MTLENNIRLAIQKTITELYQADVLLEKIILQETRKEFQGQITLVVFPMIRFSKKSPEQTGLEIGQCLKESVAEIIDFNVINGFLNLAIADAYWINQLKQVISKPDYGQFPSNGKKVMIEYSSPNTNKPLHLGHVRNNLLGHAIAEILAAYGYQVIKANLINDRGIHICKSMLAWQLFGNGETPTSTGLKGDHLVGKYYVLFDQFYKKQIKELQEAGQTGEEAEKNAPLIRQAQALLLQWEAGDMAIISLWKMMNDWVYAGFFETYQKLGVNFERYYYESDTYLLGKDIIAEGLAKNIFFKKSDNSVWIDLTADGLDEKLVLRADGTSVYISQDLGTAQVKYDDYHMDQSIYVVGNEQDYHFKILFLILKKLGKVWADGLYHLSYGMVDLPSGKMKSREGTVVDADHLIAEMIATAGTHTEELGKTNEFSEGKKKELYQMIGLGALKYFLLKIEPKKRVLFDPNESIDFQGHTGPFIQYTYARIRSILRKANSKMNYEPSHSFNLSSTERDLLTILNKYPQVIKTAAQEHNPAHIANYIFELAKCYNKFYHEEPILKTEDLHIKQFRLDVSTATAVVIQKGMHLLGISVPERM